MNWAFTVPSCAVTPSAASASASAAAASIMPKDKTWAPAALLNGLEESLSDLIFAKRLVLFVCITDIENKWLRKHIFARFFCSGSKWPGGFPSKVLHPAILMPEHRVPAELWTLGHGVMQIITLWSHRLLSFVQLHLEVFKENRLEKAWRPGNFTPGEDDMNLRS